MAGVVYASDGATATIDRSLSFWTRDGVKMESALASLGQPPTIFDGGAYAQFFNPEPFALVYTDVQLYTGNNLANFNTTLLVGFPTGQLVLGTPSTFTLFPGQFLNIPFGGVGPGYQLAIANVASAAQLGDKYFMAAAAAVPESGSSISLLAIGIIACLGPWIRRRNWA